MRRYFFAVALIAATAAAALASPGPEAERETAMGVDPVPGRVDEIPVSSEFPRLAGVERKLVYNVGKYRAPDGKRWIRLFSEYDSVYRGCAEDVIATLWDFESSHKIFSRIEETRVRSEEGDVAITEQRTGVHVLGFSYVSNLVFRNEIRRDGPKTVIEFEAIEVDRTTLSSKGSWTIVEGFDESGRPLTYLRYFLDSYVAPKFPAQEWIMRNFGESDMRKLIRELKGAATKRSKAG
jgi:hypothetical protein